jgi:hypothetical protein
MVASAILMKTTSIAMKATFVVTKASFIVMKASFIVMKASFIVRDANWLLASMGIMLMIDSAVAQSPSHPYRSASAITLAGRLKSPCLQRVEPVGAREQFDAWSMEHQVLIWLDRRIASDTIVSMDAVDSRSLLQALLEVCHQLDAELAIIDRVVMIVPRERAAGIEWAYWKLLTDQPNAAWCRPDKQTWAWSDGATAESIWSDWQQRYRLQILEDSASPPLDFERDRWRRFQWENTTPLAIGLCLLSGLDRMLESDGKGLRIAATAPPREPEPVAWLYRDEISKVGKEAWIAWRQQWPNAEVFKLEAHSLATWKIVAPVAAHRELMAPLAPIPLKPATVEKDRKRFTGRYRGELQRILAGFANQMSLELQTPSLPLALARMEIDIAFQELSVQEIAKKISIESGLELTIEEGKLRVEMK